MAIAVTNDASAFKRSANVPTATAFSLYMWVFITTVPARFYGPMAIYAGADGTPTSGTNYHQISSAASGSAQLQLGSGSGTAINLISVSAGNWYFIAMTGSGTAAGAVNAYARALTSTTLTNAVNVNAFVTMTAARIEWGRDGFTGDFIDGRIHACGASDVVLSSDELLALSFYSEPQMFGIRGLNVFYPTIESVNTNATVDRSGNARNATATVGALADGPPIMWMPMANGIIVPSALAGGGGTIFPVTMTDTLVTLEDKLAYLLRNRLSADTTVLPDSTLSVRQRNRAQSDLVTTVDTGLPYRLKTVQVTDAITLTDQILSVITGVSIITRISTDTFSVTDGNVRTVFRGRTLIDVITTLDALSDRNLKRTASISDAITLSDSFLANRLRTLVSTDGVTLIDFLSSSQSTVRTLTSSDSIIMFDQSIRSVQRTRFTQDSVVMNESILKTLQKLATILDSVVFIDETLRIRKYDTRISDTITLSEEVSKQILQAVLYEIRVLIGTVMDPVLGAQEAVQLSSNEPIFLGAFN